MSENSSDQHEIAFIISHGTPPSQPSVDREGQVSEAQVSSSGPADVSTSIPPAVSPWKAPQYTYYREFSEDLAPRPSGQPRADSQTLPRSPITVEQWRDCYWHFEGKFIDEVAPETRENLHQSRDFEWDGNPDNQARDLAKLAVSFLERAMENGQTPSVEAYKAAWSIKLFEEERAFHQGGPSS
ncbi:hypothetical protein IQ07DRAFT_654846 [Pyrenochaeta sp. DS3sAY3a]|nr:hypothetical protein IQ07DRAFT_654846 [Pyrenochaeta sp. DS3sAY3a]